ncbi:acetyl-CoA C-acyltransferase [Haloferax sp. MBLA0076]|uniref:Acetyl-CoA C-acyltransferase n=1 Tax=Haloferax litoreum TaxID=2666140 RepID=A0A6A8GFJ7_9EURY|nr:MULTISPECIES: thiolase family protein [Haloferax]KAB1192468.1 thiolase family protein [Haloferax sp. CBA1148]MRX20937.1 acetyl-CoA C-acyltransferase [Haloferax litoreum]
MQDAYIVDAVRTPFGKRNGSFSGVHPQDLAAKPLLALEERVGFTGSEDPEDVIYGCVTPIGEQGMNIGRLAPMVAGWGDDIPGVQLNRMCGSGQQAINFAAGQIRGEMHDVLVAGGVEHMTRVPMASDSAVDRLTFADPANVSATYFDHYDELTSQGEGAERIAEQWGLSRDDVDQIAVDSQSRWGRAVEAGKYDGQVVPVEVDGDSDGGTRVVEQDEHPRPETDVETLGKLPLAFRDEGEGVIHPGNASGIVDGAAATLVASGDACEEYGWEPKARIVDTHVVGVDPKTMLTGPIPATNEILDENGLDIDDIDRFEVNEAFASVIGAWLDETGAEWEKTNVWGGAIAHGHPLGATGAALLGKLPYQLEECGGRYGLCTMCIGFGQGIATLVERV